MKVRTGLYNRINAMFITVEPAKKSIWTIFFIVIATLMVDVLISNMSPFPFIAEQLSTAWSIAFFVVISSIFAIGQYTILRFIDLKRKKFYETRPSGYMGVFTHRGVTLIQSVLMAIIIFLIFQIISGSYYYTLVLTLTTTLSSVLASLMLGILAHKLLSWYRSNRSHLVLLYGLASATQAVGVIAALVFFNTILIFERPAITVPDPEIIFREYEPGSFMQLINDLYGYSNYVAFLLLWAGTAIILYHYSSKIGKVKYWIIISVPVVYFLSQVVTLAPILPSGSAPPSEYLLFLIVVYTLSPMLGGILFGIGFLTIARSVPSGSFVKDYMTLAAYGLILSYVAGTASTDLAPYPPYGVVAFSFIGLASYMVLIGIYASAVSVSEDIRVRQSLLRAAKAQSKLLDDMSKAQLVQQAKEKIIDATKQYSKEIFEQTGVQPSLTEDDLNLYLDKVLRELEARKSSKT
jgi:hypothetical protein